MKTPVTLTAALLCSAIFVRADVEVTMAQLHRIGFLPQDKADLKPEDKLDMKRRNPFAERKKVVAAKPAEPVETEESKLRTFFDKQKVSGVMKLGDKYVVTIGRLALEEGQTVPPIIPGQTQILRVIRVDDKVLEIGWVEDPGFDNTAAPRKILKKIDLKPRVQSLLASEENTGENAQMYLTDEKGKTVLPPGSVFPNPSAIVDNLPPGSDTNPNTVLNNSALTEEERDELNAAAAIQTPTPPPEPDPVPDAVPNAVPPPGAPQDNPEDSVQPDPGLVAPPETGGPTPAGPPKK